MVSDDIEAKKKKGNLKLMFLLSFPSVSSKYVEREDKMTIKKLCFRSGL
jgi:hypothetical protein